MVRPASLKLAGCVLQAVGTCFLSTVVAHLWYTDRKFMAATVEISVPEALIEALGAQPAEMPRQTIEALVVQAYRKGQITHRQVGEFLDLDRLETDGFLKKAQAFRPYESEEFFCDLERLRRISK